MRKFLLLIFLSALSVSLHAEKALVLLTVDDEKVVFILSDEPVIKVEDDEVVVTTEKDTVAYAINLLESFTIEDVEVTAIAQQPQTTLFRLTETGMHVTGLQAGEVLRVYDMNGVMVHQSKADDRGALSVTLTPGVHLVKTHGHTYKIMKR